MSRLLAPCLLVLLLLPCACDRSFESPPPVPRIEGVEPMHGYAGDTVDLTIQNPGAEGELSVFFGTAKAAILPSDGGLISVEVPVLETGDAVPIQVSTSGGQAEYDPDGDGADLFTYDGHGHPLQNRIAQERTSQVGPRAPVLIPGLPLGFYAYINGNSRQLGVAHEDFSLHVDTGLCFSPLSAALSQYPDDLTSVMYWIVGLKEGLNLDDREATTLWRGRLGLDLETESLALSALEQVDIPDGAGGLEFVPLFATPVCATPACLGLRVAVTDVMAPRVALVDPVVLGETPPVEVLEIAASDKSLCDPAERVGVAMDLVQDIPTGDLYAPVNGSPEIWRLPTDGNAPERIWPPGTDGLDCSHAIINLEKSPSRNTQVDPLRLFAVYLNPPKAVFMQRVLGTWAELDTQFMDGYPFSSATGQYEDEDGVVHDRLYVMTSSGLRVFEVADAKLEPVLSIPDYVGIGWPQALGTDEKYGFFGSTEADTIVWADEENDRLVTWQVGAEEQVSHVLPLGMTAPNMARSPTLPYDFIQDPIANSVQVLDQDSAAPVGQFGIAGNLGFGVDGIATLGCETMDLLILPRVAGTPGQGYYDGITVRRVDEGVGLPDCAASLLAGNVTEANMLVLPEPEGRFDRVTLIQTPEPKLVFVRNVDRDSGAAGQIWTRDILCDGSTLDASIIGEVNIRQEYNTPYRLQAMDEKSQVVALATDKEATQAPALIIVDIEEGRILQYEDYTNLLRNLTTGLEVRRSADGEAYTIYLAMGELGQVRTLRLDADGALLSEHVLTTGGRPNTPFISPDGRRLYVAHVTHSLVSIIDIEDDRLDLINNLNTRNYPYKVIFDPDGGRAVVLHIYNGHQTVIE